MEKRFQIIDEKTLECSVLVVLTDSEVDILECPDLRSQIDNIAKDLHVRWAIETNGNVTHATISKVLGPIGTSHEAHALEIKATNFMSAVDKLTLPVFDEAACPTHEPANEDAEVIAERLAFCKEVRADMDDVENIHVIGAKLIAGNEDIRPFVADAGRIGATLLKELLDLYIEKYDHE